MEKANLKAREYRFFSQKNQKMICLHSEQALACSVSGGPSLGSRL